MSVETFEISDIITVTPAAAEHFASQLDKSGKSAIRISLKQSGCTGYKYVIDEVAEPVDGDLKIELANQVSVYLESSSVGALRGTQVDYTREGLNRNLVLNNPNVTDACGCGESFNFS